MSLDDKNITDQNVMKLANERFGTRPTLLFYVNKAKNAGDRANVAITTQNSLALGAEVQLMREAISKLSLLLNDDKVSVAQEK